MASFYKTNSTRGRFITMNLTFMYFTCNKLSVHIKGEFFKFMTTYSMLHKTGMIIKEIFRKLHYYDTRIQTGTL